ncbi:uncharacterized protein N7525_009003 [Penicillium rubens]|uniref:uncharacterized protein n=1 Tax=Penicillium rubens TaxID=1108849 RepID=UPI002A5AABEF|nr:uncharacterized protein N7525_009003 [Penicillium rubens]KAJ5830750.1 hypothetical protein N7525_009003 [Penicillium rubens]KAJ5854332.1 hypothetical protein N7534_006875 [Penicillium rubens]
MTEDEPRPKHKTENFARGRGSRVLLLMTDFKIHTGCYVVWSTISHSPLAPFHWTPVTGEAGVETSTIR